MIQFRRIDYTNQLELAGNVVLLNHWSIVKKLVRANLSSKLAINFTRSLNYDVPLSNQELSSQS